MLKRIKLFGREIEYDLQRKRVKNINLRIKPDKSITVSANERVPERAIERFIIEKQYFVLRALEKYDKMKKTLQKPKQLIDGERVKVFGKDFEIKVLLAKKNYVEIEDCFIKLRVKNTEDALLKKKVLEKWLNYQVEEIVNRLCEKVYLDFKKYCDVFPLIRYRRMKSRWGSCHIVKKILTFNYALINASIECVEYVVYHEFTHFIQPNHSKKFYLTLGGFLPDYKERRKELKKISIF